MVSTHASPPSPDTGVWTAFPGGELEGRRPRGLCPPCRDRAARTGTLCFQCYRVDLDRLRALNAAAELDTASEARFQSMLPLEPVNRPRLERLRTERAEARTLALGSAAGSFADRQRRAQIAARHALQRIAAAPAGDFTNITHRVNPVDAVNHVNIDMAIHAAELQLPEAWLPFVVSL